MNWPRFLFELALFHFELALPSLNRPFKNDTFSSHFLLWLMICSSCEWMFRMFMVTMATCGYHEHALRSPIGDPVPQSHWSDALPPHLHQRGVLTVTDLPTGQRTILPCYLSMAEWSVTGPWSVNVADLWVLVIWTPWSRSPAPNTLTDPCPRPPPTHLNTQATAPSRWDRHVALRNEMKNPWGDSSLLPWLMPGWMSWYGVGGKVMDISLAGWISGAGPIQGTFWLTESDRRTLNRQPPTKRPEFRALEMFEFLPCPP